VPRRGAQICASSGGWLVARQQKQTAARARRPRVVCCRCLLTCPARPSCGVSAQLDPLAAALLALQHARVWRAPAAHPPAPTQPPKQQHHQQRQQQQPQGLQYVAWTPHPPEPGAAADAGTGARAPRHSLRRGSPHRHNASGATAREQPAVLLSAGLPNRRSYVWRGAHREELSKVGRRWHARERVRMPPCTALHCALAGRTQTT
jgi:hypothetical protein